MSDMLKSYVKIEITFNDNSLQILRAFPRIPGGQYWSNAESVFLGGLGKVEGWLHIVDIDNTFYAISITCIKEIVCKYVEV